MPEVSAKPLSGIPRAEPKPAASGPQPVATDAHVDWIGTDRYRVVRVLGEGGMGVVYEAIDALRGQPVALKTLLHFEPAGLYRFKQEFRTLADAQHPNLVRLHELVVSDGGRAFFTMELVRGVDFIAHVHGAAHGGEVALRGAASDVLTVHPASRAAVAGSARREDPTSQRPPSPADIDRLRPALRQLVEGVMALHAAGKLHRDIKPSNVLVASDGRVVLLDFGVATELARDPAPSNDAEGIVGTARYMAPEQALGEALVPASDWYSVGVVLYEALSGRPPFGGTEMDVLALKAQLAPVPASQFALGVPPDLDALCQELLDPDPARRPSGLEILRKLGIESSARAHLSLLPLPKLDALVGRESQLRALHDAFASAAAGRSVTITVGGASGMGKSAVVHHFLDGLAERGEATVLRGRAYERESVPYKAFDGVVDALSRHLAELEERDPIELPAGAGALARIFPVLRRIARFQDLPEDVSAPLLVRGRAFGALRDLLGSLARRGPLVVFLDDVQWGDGDSAGLFLELVRPPQPPPALFVFTYRDNEAKESAFLNALRGRRSSEAEPVDLVVGPLSARDGYDLALELLGATDERTTRIATAVAREAHGSPFLIQELVRTNRSALAREDGNTLIELTLGQLVAERMERLSPDARRLVEIVAVGGRPMPFAVVAEAAEVLEADDAVAAASARRFLHSRLRDGQEVVETSHDRFRETIVMQLGEATVRRHHARLARVLERAPGVDPEAVAMHLLGAGERERAADLAEQAAEQATAKLAFGQAERLLRMALDIFPIAGADAARVQERLGVVLEGAGRGGDSARAYLAAAERVSLERRVELQRAAAEQLLSCGQMDEGAAVLHGVLAAVGLRGPRTPGAALLRLIFYRIWAAIRAARYRGPDGGAMRPEDRLRIDVLYAAAMGFSIVDVILGASMQAWHTVVALRRGDRARALRAISLETSHLASEGGPERKRERSLVRMGNELATRIEADAGRAGGATADTADLHGPAFFRSNRGVALFLRGRWKEAREVLDAAYERTRNHHAGWQANANVFGCYALLELGELEQLDVRARQLLADAEQRGDLYTSVNLRTTMAVTLALRDDDVERAQRVAREAINLWSRRAFLVQHMQTMVYEARTALYTGAWEEAFDRTERDWRALKKSFLFHVQFIRGFTFTARGVAAAAAAQATPARRVALLKEARRLAGSLEGERMPWLAAMASAVRATIANVECDGPGTVACLRTLIERAEAVNMALYVNAARFRLGTLLGGPEGEELTRSAELALRERGVRNVGRFVGVWLPGEWGSKSPTA